MKWQYTQTGNWRWFERREHAMSKQSIVKWHDIHPESSAWSRWEQYWTIHLWHGIAHLFQVRVPWGRGRDLPVRVLRVNVLSALNVDITWCATWDEVENIPTIITSGWREISNEWVAHELALHTHWKFKLVKRKSRLSIKWAADGMAVRTCWEFKLVEAMSLPN